jgi:hypothetical protein
MGEQQTLALLLGYIKSLARRSCALPWMPKIGGRQDYWARGLPPSTPFQILLRLGTQSYHLSSDHVPIELITCSSPKYSCNCWYKVSSLNLDLDFPPIVFSI